MEKIIQIYQAITVKSIVYETGDSEAKVNCDLVLRNKTISTQLLVSQSDLNRLISKMVNKNSQCLDSKQILFLEDGVELIEYDFDTTGCQTIHNFHFNNTYAQIGA